MGIPKKKKRLNFKFGDKHKEYIRNCRNSTINIAEGSIRAGKTVDNVFAFAYELKKTSDKIHLATGSTIANAKLNIGDCNGLGLEAIFRGQSHWGKYKGNEALIIKGEATNYKERIVIFSGGAKADSFKKIRGNSYGMWIATEINLHHDTTIKEAFNRTVASNKRIIFWDLNPDHPKANIYTEYIDVYIDKNKRGEMVGGFNYQHFTLDDNININEERKREIKSQYNAGSVWYARDILGLRKIADGLIYLDFANDIKKYEIKKENVPSYFNFITIGVDIGGNKSHHAFVATGITLRYQKLIALASERINPNGTPDDFNKSLVSFIKKVIAKYGVPHEIRFESAEQVLKRGAEVAIMNDLDFRNRKINIAVKNSIKNPINDRIKMTDSLMATGRFFITEDCDSLKEALSTCIWDLNKIQTFERLDDGSSDIDTLDAFEYSFEKHIKPLQLAISRGV